MSIPKIIHYCWFGNNEKPEIVKKCIESWKKFLPDFEIKEWNDTHLHLIDLPYVKEANECKKYAFISDVFRLYALKEYGGIYLDTDVEIKKEFNDFLELDFFCGFENYQGIINPTISVVGATKDNKIITEFLNEYTGLRFIVNDKPHLYPNTKRFSDFLFKNYNLENFSGENIVKIENNSFIYPYYYFINLKDDKNYSVHHFEGSWLKKKNNSFLQNIFSLKNQRIGKTKYKLVTLFGLKFKLNSKILNTTKKVDWNINKRFESKTLPMLYKKTVKLGFFKFSKKVNFKKNNKQNIRICFIISGGFGDCLIKTNYIYNFYQFLKKENYNNVIIDVYAEDIYKEYLFASVGSDTFVNDVEVLENFKNDKGYDLITHLWVNVNVWYYNSKKIKNLAPKLFDLIMQYKKFYEENSYWGPDDGAALANKYALANNKHKLQILDVNSILNIGKEFNLPIPYPTNENEILKKFGLDGKTFITINRGISKFDPSNEGTKMWSLQNSNELIVKIKKEFPLMTIVQLGVNDKWCKTLDVADLNLIGKTTIEDIKVLIKNSFLHIDCEGGFAHLRNALKAKYPAIVLFGPTDPKIYAYRTNINIYNNSCPICCEWDTLAWQKTCINRNNPNICMKSIAVEDVFKTIKKYILENSTIN